MLQFDLERRPFIFSNSEGVHQDIVTLLHESGHAFHTVLGAERSPMAGMRPPIEFAEVASMAMELLPLPYFDAFYPDPAERERAQRKTWLRVLNVLITSAIGEEFQSRIYVGEPEGDPCDVWQDVVTRFTPGTDWDGLEEILRINWQRVTHFFCMPFYYVEYGFAQMAALSLARSAETQPTETLERYIRGLRLGPSGTATGLYRAIDLPLLPEGSEFTELVRWLDAKLGGAQRSENAARSV